MDEKRKQVADQCRAVVHMAEALAEVYSDYAEHIIPVTDDGIVETVGKRTASLMEALGDVLNGMDAVDESDEWMRPVFEKAHELWPTPRH